MQIISKLAWWQRSMDWEQASFVHIPLSQRAGKRARCLQIASNEHNWIVWFHTESSPYGHRSKAGCSMEQRRSRFTYFAPRVWKRLERKSQSDIRRRRYHWWRCYEGMFFCGPKSFTESNEKLTRFFLLQALKGAGMSFRVSAKPDIETHADYRVPSMKTITWILQWLQQTMT